MKLKTCKQCKAEFKPHRSMQSVCSIKCAKMKARADFVIKQSKADAKRLRERKAKLKTLGEHKKELQVIFNQYIRLRDTGQPCISCQRHHQGQIHAGHYRTVGSAPHLRFEPANCHAQCAPCNNHLSGNLIEYRKNLINKIGIEMVEAIESDQTTRKYSIDDIIEMKAHYRQLCRELKAKAA